MQTVLYFHGFESNCQTEKFARTKAFFAEHGLELVGLDVNYAEFPPPVIDQIVAEIFSRHDVWRVWVVVWEAIGPIAARYCIW